MEKDHLILKRASASRPSVGMAAFGKSWRGKKAGDAIPIEDGQRLWLGHRKQPMHEQN